MTFELSQITKGKHIRPPRILLYAPPKVGKSTWAANIPNHLFLNVEDGLDGIDCTKTPKIKSAMDAMDVIVSLYKEDHPYKCLVVDTMDWLEKLICNEIAEKYDKKVVEDIPFGKGYPMVVDRWGDFLKGFSALREDKDMMIVMLCHADVKKYQPPLGDEYDIYTPKLYGKKDKSVTSLALLQEFSDAILFGNYKVLTKDVGEGFAKRKQAIGNPERILYCGSNNPTFVAGNRYGLPDELPFTWRDFWDSFNKNALGQDNLFKQKEKEKKDDQKKPEKTKENVS